MGLYIYVLYGMTRNPARSVLECKSCIRCGLRENYVRSVYLNTLWYERKSCYICTCVYSMLWDVVLLYLYMCMLYGIRWIILYLCMCILYGLEGILLFCICVYSMVYEKSFCICMCMYYIVKKESCCISLCVNSMVRTHVCILYG